MGQKSVKAGWRTGFIDYGGARWPSTRFIVTG
jgi:hypothetical protein